MRQPAFEPSMPPSPADRGEIDMIALFREVGRRKWLVAAATIGALVLSTAAVNVVKPRYTAETRVFLENRDTEYTRIGRDGGRASDPLIDQDAVLSQVQLIQSRDVARALIKRFDLGSRPEFDDLLNGVDAVTKVGVLLGVFNNPAAMSPEERVLEKYFDKLKAFPVAKSRVIAIEFQSKDPELAAKLSDAIADEYIRQLESAKKGSAKAAGSWLGRSIEQLRERVAAAEAKVEAYRTQNGLFSVGGGVDGGNISSQQLSELNTQLAAARATQAELSSKARIIRDAIRQGRIFDVSDVANNEVVRRLIENRATLKALIAQEERTLLPQHPRIKELNGQLAGLEDQVRSAADRAARALENDSRAAGARVAASQAELDLQKRASGAANEQEVQLRALEREAKAERDQLETYLGRYRDASARDADNAVAADARIVSRAIVPGSPSFPKRIPIILVATLSGLAISLFWILTRALLSDAVYARRTYASARQDHPDAWAMARQPYAVAIHAAAPASAPTAAGDDSPVPAERASEERASDERASNERARFDEPHADHAEAENRQPGVVRRSADMMTRILRGAHPQPASAQPRQHDAVAPIAESDAAGAKPTPDFAALPDEPAAQPSAPPLAPTTEDVARMGADVVASPASFDEANPLVEVAEEAEAALIRGRPVSILILSIESARHAWPTATALEKILLRRGSVTIAGADAEDLRPDEFKAVLRACAGEKDYVLVNAGLIGPRSAALSRTATLTVLVASDNILDPRVDDAGHLLPGCNYFIVGAEAAEALLSA